MADERRTKRRFDNNRPAHVRDRDPWPRQPEDGPIPLFENFPDTRKAAKSLECHNRAIEDTWDDYDIIFYNAWLQVSIELTRFIDPDVVQALGIRSDLEDLFVEFGMGNFATHPQVLYPELVRQFMATVNVYYTHERAKKASEGVLTFFICGVRYRVPLLTLCTIYGFETERQHTTWLKDDRDWSFKDGDGIRLVRLPLLSFMDFFHGLSSIQFRPDHRLVQVPVA
ncbi:hypothetical protein F2Q69_00027590 [Brassica cretica]|uniref:Arabidopsis retrotransposon Orf1 C-terminal domain-containing protein n=1 Tax=Brassica cretica TaxID=69181 RepID=A0A8S9RSI5_BRACR|nr:hypothetical protein F2Q69_00027590 [Brassica cretica]